MACLVVGGLLLSLGLGFLELRRTTSLMQVEMTQRLGQITQNLQAALGSLLAQGSTRDVQEALHVYLRDPWLRGIRVTDSQGVLMEAGSWDPDLEKTISTVLTVSQQGLAYGTELDFSTRTMVRAPIMMPGQVLLLELWVDGPAVMGQLRARVISGLTMQWLLMGALALLGLLLMRRWFTGPLSDIVQLVKRGSGAEHFYQLSQRCRGEFAQLAEAIGGMLTRIDATAQCLRQRERAFEDLYQFAPASMLSLDAQGKVVDANRRAAQLLGLQSERELIGKVMMDFVRPEDRARARQTIDRLELEPLTRCELRLNAGSRMLDVLLECTGVRDESGALRQVRISLLDVTQSHQLQNELAEKGRLLNLIVDHMSDAILLVDKHNRVAAYNQKLATLLRCRVDQRLGTSYSTEYFWNDLGLLDAELFVKRMNRSKPTTPAQLVSVLPRRSVYSLRRHPCA
ncbi:MAG: PAS domain S-box protein [Phycisphaerales bacterium]|nr:PAS domain S-box protein [Phycisphaerales bacterium]